MKVVEFFGISRSGKTTQIRELARTLRQEDVSVSVFERPKVSFKESGGMESFHRMLLGSMVQTYEEALERREEVLLYDRGFYDRFVMLTQDHAEGLITQELKDELIEMLEPYREKVTHPLLFITPPVLSLQRMPAQKSNGLDNSGLCEGLPTRDTYEGLTGLVEAYRGLMQAYPRVIEVTGTLGIEETTRLISSRVQATTGEKCTK